MGGRHRARAAQVWRARLVIAITAALGLVAVGLTQDPAVPSRPVAQPVPAAVTTSAVSLVQGVPGAVVDVVVDGRTVSTGVDLGKVVGPLQLRSGSHEVRFVGRDDASSTAATVTVGSGAAQDVVLHAPENADADPVVSVYRTPTAPIGAGKARVLLAHTAEVGAADIWVDGERVFTDMANGQFAQADVPAGMHRVAIRPTGAASSSTPVLGPLPVDLGAGTVTLAYAVGNPGRGDMSVVAHAERLRADGSVAPVRIHTGSAGLASTFDVRDFG